MILTKRFLPIVCLFLLLTLTVDARQKKKISPPVESDQTIELPSVKKIRVLLEDHNSQKETKFLIKSKDGFVLESPVDSGTTALYQEKELHLLCRNNRLYFGCRDHKYRAIKKNSIDISSASNKLMFKGTTYQGNITIRVDEKDGKVLVINKLELEDYVYSVIRYEALPYWPHGMQKVQAIISRTYAVFLMTRARQKNPWYRYFDIKNTNLHQVYNGAHDCTHLRQAIEETHDIILTYKGSVALTMFDICCGGSSPALMRHRDPWKPYLCRKQRCTYCSNAPAYQWKMDLLTPSFYKQLTQSPTLQHKFKNLGKKIVDVKITDTDKSGLVHKVRFFGSNGKTATLTGKEIRTTFQPRVKSATFSIKKIRDRIVVSGKGYGHQQGVCQYGAKEMVDRGWATKGILSYYYPGTKLSRLL